MPNVKTYYVSKNGNERIQPNFLVREFRCKDGTDKLLIDKEMTFILQYIRNRLGPITINSAYRTPSYNKKVGGASNSYHLYGRAFDITNSSKQLTAISNIAYSLGVKGIIKYGTFIHIDSRPNQYFANSSGTRITYNHYDIPFEKVCKYGSRDLQTALIQFKLNSLKYNCGIVDGIYGTDTHDAVVKFQKAVGFKGKDVDGIVGRMTWNKLFN